MCYLLSTALSFFFLLPYSLLYLWVVVVNQVDDLALIAVLHAGAAAADGKGSAWSTLDLDAVRGAAAAGLADGEAAVVVGSAFEMSLAFFDEADQADGDGSDDDDDAAAAPSAFAAQQQKQKQQQQQQQQHPPSQPSPLRELRLCGCNKLRDRSLRSIAHRCPALHTLAVTGCILMGCGEPGRNGGAPGGRGGGAAFVELAQRCPALSVVHAARCRGVSDAAVQALVRHCPSLSDLDVSHCRKLGPACVDALTGVGGVVGAPRKLRRLRLAGCRHAFDQSLDHLRATRPQQPTQQQTQQTQQQQQQQQQQQLLLPASARPAARLAASLGSALRSISFAYIAGVDAAALAALGAHCPMLAELSLAYCGRGGDAAGHDAAATADVGGEVGDAALTALADCCPLLRRLDLAGCFHLTDVGVKALAARCACLRALGLAGCHGVSDEALFALGVGCPALAALSLAGVGGGITDLGVMALLGYQTAGGGGGGGSGSGGGAGWRRRCSGGGGGGGGRGYGGQATAGQGGDGEAGEENGEAGTGGLGARPGSELRFLDVSACPRVGDGAARALALRCRLLRALELSALREAPRRGLTDGGLRALAAGCPRLSRVRLEGCCAVTDAGVRALLSSLPALELLALGDPPRSGADGEAAAAADDVDEAEREEAAAAVEIAAAGAAAARQRQERLRARRGGAPLNATLLPSPSRHGGSGGGGLGRGAVVSAKVRAEAARSHQHSVVTALAIHGGEWDPCEWDAFAF